MKHLAWFATLFIAACAADADHIDEVAQDIASSPAFADGNTDDGEAELDQLVLQYCGMTRDGVTTYKGLSGTYQRLGLTEVDEPLKLKLLATKDDPDAQGTFSGTYTSANGQPAPYAGRFAALPDNPAIGAAFALDINSDGEYDKVYFVLAVRRSFGLVRGICLAGAQHPFLLSRSWF
jgi:hypothetical protein